METQTALACMDGFKSTYAHMDSVRVTDYKKVGYVY